MIKQLPYDFIEPYGVDVDAVGNIVVADYEAGLLLFDSKGNFVKEIGCYCRPISVAIDSAGHIVVGNCGEIYHLISVYLPSNQAKDYDNAEKIYFQ